MSLTQLLRAGFKEWHGTKINAPDWSDCSHSIAFSAEALEEPIRVYVILNAYWEALEFELPQIDGQLVWRRWIDTFREPPEDIVPWEAALPLAGYTYRAEPRSVIVLWAYVPRALERVP